MLINVLSCPQIVYLDMLELNQLATFRDTEKSWPRLSSTIPFGIRLVDKVRTVYHGLGGNPLNNHPSLLKVMPFVPWYINHLEHTFVWLRHRHGAWPPKPQTLPLRGT